MNERQRAFADNFLRTGNATRAAVEAGYSATSAATTGGRLLKKADVARYIGDKTEQMSNESIATAADCMTFLTQTMRGQVLDVFGLDASLADRLRAATELLKRYNKAETNSDTMQRLDVILAEFQKAVQNDDTGGKAGERDGTQ